MKNRISRGKLLRILLCIIILSALATVTGAERIPDGGTGRVKILILSKHIRLLKNGEIISIECILPESADLAAGRKRIPCKKLSIEMSDGNFLLKTGNRSFRKGDMTLFPRERGETFLFEVNGEKRNYPLPLYIKNSGNKIELSIDENVNQFAIDSAWGELGDISEIHFEALYSLALLIKARSALPYLTSKHKGYDFCDLTCCQTYKGRSGLTFDYPVSIKTDGLKNGLFFYSSGGGTIFSDSIFNNRERITAAPEDFIYSENFKLSSEKYPLWKASIDEHELAGILYPEKNTTLTNITYDQDKEILIIKKDNAEENYSPEGFRIRVNRVKGWNFLKSNNYLLTNEDGVYKFSGSGLGHGAGMSLEGALQLAEKGYSRYEILEHYYPEIEYSSPSSASNHQLQYIIFDYKSGKTVKSSSGPSLRNRIIPCGSIFKLLIALYIAEKRTDLFYNYTWICREKEKSKFIPAECWKKSGHGRMNIRSALYNSCNKYFASLYNKIDQEDFNRWIMDFNMKQGIALTMPEIKSKSDFANLLAGLNFRLTITVSGIIKLNRYIYMEHKESRSVEIEEIFNALHKTFSEGTAAETGNDRSGFNISSKAGRLMKDLWGKTGTVIAGTNSHHGYGIFTGGLSSLGIVSILRRGTGAIAAKESKKILLNEPPAPLF